MKKKLLGIILTTLSFQVLGDVTPKSAYEVCGRISSDDTRSECFEVAYSGIFDKYAAGACDKITSAYPTIDCMKTIKNNHFNRDAISACSRLVYSYSTIDCLEMISNKRYEYIEVRICDSYSSALDAVQCFSEMGVRTSGTGAQPQTSNNNSFSFSKINHNGQITIIAKIVPSRVRNAPFNVNFHVNDRYIKQIRSNENGSLSYTTPSYTVESGDLITIKVLQYFGSTRNDHLEYSKRVW